MNKKEELIKKYKKYERQQKNFGSTPLFTLAEYLEAHKEDIK